VIYKTYIKVSYLSIISLQLRACLVTSESSVCLFALNYCSFVLTPKELHLRLHREPCRFHVMYVLLRGYDSIPCFVAREPPLTVNAP